MATLPSDFIETDPTHPGSADFDVADRLAVINLCNAYGEGYDSGDLDEWFKLFTENPTCTIRLSDSAPIFSSGDEWRRQMKSYRTGAQDLGIAPIHSVTNLTVKIQTRNRALVETYILYVPVDIATLNNPEESRQSTRLTGTAQYVFGVVKGDDGIWRIDEYWITMKQLEV